jgi:ketosteroid isomerase-like protein
MPAFTPWEIHSLFERAFNTGDIEGILALYEPGAVLVTGGKPVTGHDGIRDAYTVFLSSGARMNLDTRAVIESGVEHRGRAPPTGRQLDVCY